MVLFVALTTRRLFGPQAGLVAAVVSAGYGPLLIFPSYLLKPNLFVPLIAALVWLLVRAGEGRSRSALVWLVVGVLCGLGALLRGNLLVLLPVLVPLPFWIGNQANRPSNGLLGVGLLLVGIAGVLGPVAWRNYEVGGVFALTTSGAGTNLYGGNNVENPYGRATEFSWVRGIPEHEFGDWKREAERRVERELDPVEVSDFWVGETLRSVRERPLVHLGILWNKLRLTLGRYEIPDNHHLGWDADHLRTMRIPWPGFGLIGWLGLAGMLAFLQSGRVRDEDGLRDPAGAGFVLLCFVLYTGTIVLTVTSMRVRLGLVPLLMPFAAWFVVRVAAGISGGSGKLRGERARLGRLVLPAALAALPVFVPVLSSADREADLAKRDYNRAVYLLEDEGRVDEALAIALRLDEAYPQSPRVLVLLAQVRYAEGKALLADGGTLSEASLIWDEALKTLRDVVEDESTTPRDLFAARALAGYIQLETGHWDSAVRHFAEAFEFDPSDRNLRLGYANALYESALSRSPDDETRARLLLCEELLAGLTDEQTSAELDRLLVQVTDEIVR